MKWVKDGRIEKVLLFLGRERTSGTLVAEDGGLTLQGSKRQVRMAQIRGIDRFNEWVHINFLNADGSGPYVARLSKGWRATPRRAHWLTEDIRSLVPGMEGVARPLPRTSMAQLGVELKEGIGGVGSFARELAHEAGRRAAKPATRNNVRELAEELGWPSITIGTEFSVTLVGSATTLRKESYAKQTIPAGEAAWEAWLANPFPDLSSLMEGGYTKPEPNMGPFLRSALDALIELNAKQGS